MKILLVAPPLTQKERYGNLSEIGTLYPPLGLAYIAAVAEEAGHNVKVVDCEALEYDYSDLYKVIEKYKPDVLGMTTFCTVMDRVYKIAEKTKKICNNCSVVLGGVQTTIEPMPSLKRKDVDFIIYGEGEVTFVEFLKEMQKPAEQRELSKIKGLFWKDTSGKILMNEKRELIQDLDALPFPARHLFPMEKYHGSANLRGKKVLNIMTSRGCPFNCSYCSSHLSFGKTHRFRSAKDVVAEMKELNDEYGCDSIQFYDESFTMNRNRVIELCKEIKKSKLHIPWTCFTRVNLVDQQMLNIMADSGCYQIFYGIESGVQRLLNLIRKGITLEQSKKALKMTRKAGIESMASLMLAIPTETEEESWQTVNFAIEIDPDYAQWLKTTPFPGNDLYELCKKSGNIITDDYTKYTEWNEAVYVPEGRTVEEVTKTTNQAYRKFYLRPKYILRRMNAFMKLPLPNQYKLVKTAFKVFFSKHS
jgi:radical SAM superfamily enzyme YgiQ (UPF0313 family)